MGSIIPSNGQTGNFSIIVRILSNACFLLHFFLWHFFLFFSILCIFFPAVIYNMRFFTLTLAFVVLAAVAVQGKFVCVCVSVSDLIGSFW
jgi:succinate-acetate transporter protein